MATYTAAQLYGTGSIGEDLSGAGTFTFTNPGDSSYFTLETIPNATGSYAGAPLNTSGSWVVSASMGFVSSSYVASVVVQPGSSSLTFTPAASITGTTYRLRGTGIYNLIIGAGGGVIDSDAQAYFDRVTTAGGTLSATEQTAVNTLVVSMKSAGIWTAMKAIYPMVGASAAACAQNLKSSSYTGTFSSGWTFTSLGVAPNATSAYMDTNLNIGTQLTQTNSHASFYSRTIFDNVNYPTVIGAYGTSLYTQGIELYIRRQLPGDKGGGDIGSYTTSVINFTETDARKFAIISRKSATSLKYYTNGILRATDTTSDTTGFGSVNAYISAGNYVTGTAQNFSRLECAFASLGDGLTDQQASDFYTAVQAFQTSLSRQV